MSSALRRIIRLQRQILKTIRADVRKVLGPQSKELRKYYDAYKREFRGPFKTSNKAELVSQCLKSNIVLIGDYHTFGQSQKTALRLLREIVTADRSVLALEMIPFEFQKYLESWLAGKCEDEEFLRLIRYDSSWGFPWKNFKPLLDFAKENQIPVLALNLRDPDLEKRDRFAAERLASYLHTYPERRILCLYGDLHLARGHIPKHIKNELKERNIKAKMLTVFQNSESLYWRLAQSNKNKADVVCLTGSEKRYCIMNATPWVKLQSFLQWTESDENLIESCELYNETYNLHEVAHDLMNNLAETLELKLPKSVDFSIQTMDNLSFLSFPELRSGPLSTLTRDQIKTVKYHVYGNRTLLIPHANSPSSQGSAMIYLSTHSINHLAEAVSLLIHSSVSRNHSLYVDPKEHFYGATLRSMLAYFGSKILNHRRKCDLEDDFKNLVYRPKTSKLLPQEKLLHKVAKQILKHTRAQREYLRTKKFRSPSVYTGPDRLPIFLESTRCLGAMLGEKLYLNHVNGRYPLYKIQRLFMSNYKTPADAREDYLKILRELADYELDHSSKDDLL